MVGICSFLLIVLFGIPISLIIDHIIDYRRALQKHRMFPDVYPNPKKKKPRKLTEEEKLAIEKSRKVAEEATNWVAERNKKIRDLFYEDYVSEGDFVKIKTFFKPDYSTSTRPIIKCERPGLYRIVQIGSGCNAERTKMRGSYKNTYEEGKRSCCALCEKILTDDGRGVPESERTKTAEIFMFKDMMKCAVTGEIIYEDIEQWAKEQRGKMQDLTGFNDDLTQDKVRNMNNTIKQALCVPVAYAKYIKVYPACGITFFWFSS